MILTGPLGRTVHITYTSIYLPTVVRQQELQFVRESIKHIANIFKLTLRDVHRA